MTLLTGGVVTVHTRESGCPTVTVRPANPSDVLQRSPPGGQGYLAGFTPGAWRPKFGLNSKKTDDLNQAKTRDASGAKSSEAVGRWSHVARSGDIRVEDAA